MNKKSSAACNTNYWIQEIIFGIQPFDNPVYALCEQGQKRIGSIIMLPQINCCLMLIAAFKRTGSFLLIPVSPYHFPSMEFEVILPDSQYVLETWNCRIVKENIVAEAILVDQISQEDISAIMQHYNFVFGNHLLCHLNVGKKFSVLSKEEEDLIQNYVMEESIQFNESVFSIVFDHEELLYDFFSVQTKNKENVSETSAVTTIDWRKITFTEESSLPNAAEKCPNEEKTDNFF